MVVGAGVAGLACAAALAEAGWEVRLLEREARPRAEGAGLTLWPNAVRALRELGLERVLAGCAEEIREGVTLRPSGEVIARAPLERIAARFGPLVALHRRELIEALAAACPVAVEPAAGVSCEEGRLCSAGEALEADLVVGADGIGSAVRDLVAPGTAPRPAGYSAWRGISQTGALTPRRVSETLGRGRRFGLVPLPGGEPTGSPSRPGTGAGTAPSRRSRPGTIRSRRSSRRAPRGSAPTCSCGTCRGCRAGTASRRSWSATPPTR